ncbi:hypothetical protein [Streptomyces sp. NPDC001933]|uniref:hypothetical protein n=1 Tax=Streptomyces sp. NPDC001933 TaxID=3364626 RepID=UPI0036A00B9F
MKTVALGVALLTSMALAAPGVLWAAGRGTARGARRGTWLRLQGWACLVLHLAVLAHAVPRLAQLSGRAASVGDVVGLALLATASGLTLVSTAWERAARPHEGVPFPGEFIAGQRESK